MAGKKTELKVDESVEDLDQTNASEGDFAPEELSGEIIRPAVLHASEASTMRSSHEKDGMDFPKESAVAPERTVFRDNTVNFSPTKTPEGHLVKVRVNRYVRFRHGKDFYEMFKGSVYEVPDDVKTSLKNSGYLEVV